MKIEIKNKIFVEKKCKSVWKISWFIIIIFFDGSQSRLIPKKHMTWPNHQLNQTKTPTLLAFNFLFLVLYISSV